MLSITLIGLDITTRSGTKPKQFWKTIAEMYKELGVLQDAEIARY